MSWFRPLSWPYRPYSELNKAYKAKTGGLNWDIAIRIRSLYDINMACI
jgi:hypothetical protein